MKFNKLLTEKNLSIKIGTNLDMGENGTSMKFKLIILSKNIPFKSYCDLKISQSKENATHFLTLNEFSLN